MGRAWNAENRRTAVYPTAPGSADKKLTFAYDCMGRRVEKKTLTWNGSTWAQQAGDVGQRRWQDGLWTPEKSS